MAWGLLLASLCGLAVVVAPPVAAAGGWPYADLLRWLLHPVCHQIPARSFHLFGQPLAVCHRCLGLYVGFTLGVAAWPHLPSLASKLASAPRSIVAFFAPLLIDLFLVQNTAASRFATGLIASFPVALLPLLLFQQRKEQPALDLLPTKENN